MKCPHCNGQGRFVDDSPQAKEERIKQLLEACSKAHTVLLATVMELPAHAYPPAMEEAISYLETALQPDDLDDLSQADLASLCLRCKRCDGSGETWEECPRCFGSGSDPVGSVSLGGSPLCGQCGGDGYL